MLDIFQPHNSRSEKFDFKIAKVLSKSRFPIILVEASTHSECVVLKLFPLSEGRLTKSFLQETTVLGLNHPNIIKLHQGLTNFPWGTRGDFISAVLMEYALKGDLCKLLKTAPSLLSEEAVRTLFHQLIDGIEYLHSRGIAHLDLKPDNLFFDDNFVLKIGDFDQVTLIQEEATSSKGTPGYRSPELKEQKCSNLPAADIFSAGVILFVMRSRVPPFVEGKLFKEKNLYEELTQEDKSNFWEIHSKVQNSTTFYDPAFRNLIEQMLHCEPECRPSIDQIKKTSWYNGFILEPRALVMELSGLARS